MSNARTDRSPIRQFLVDYWEGDDDLSMAHTVIFAASDFEAVRATVGAFSQHVDWLQQQCDERAELKARLDTAEAQLESAKQPLHGEMLRLNKRVIELTAELDRANLTSAQRSIAGDLTEARRQNEQEKVGQARGQAEPLTDERIRAIACGIWGYVSSDHLRMFEFARAIEREITTPTGGSNG
jgi:small-conductance mechanosensitive channel